MMNKILLIFFLFMVSYASFAQQLTVSDADSRVAFVIKNMGANVEGTLKGLKGKLQFDPKNLAASAFDVTIDVNTINTNNTKRDNHLKKDDFFDAEKYPVIRIVTSQIISKGGNKYKAVGALTIKNVTKKIGFELDAKPSSSGYQFTSTFTINRRDFGVGGGSMVMGDMVNVSLDVTAKK